MNYQKHYDLLMKKAQSRAKPDGYTERHHIMPRSMGGSNNKENLVDLTAREHFVAHYLWAKVHGGNQWFAIYRMKGHQCKIYMNSRLFEIARKYAAEQKSKDMIGENNVAKRDDVRKKLKDNNGMNNPIHRAKYDSAMKGDNHPRRRNPEKWAHLKGVKRIINAPKGADHHNSRKIRCVETNAVFDTLNMAVDWLREQGKKAYNGNIVTGAQNGKMRYGYHWEYV